MFSFFKKLLVLGIIILISTQFGTLYLIFQSVPSMVEASESKKYRFVKINKQGRAISNDNGPWHCVYDRELDIVWLVGRDDESPFDSYWSYSWFNKEHNVGVKERGTCFYNEAGCDTSHIQHQAIKRKVCNISDWRLPYAEELIALVQTPTKTGGLFIQHAFFPHVQKGDYWSQTHSSRINPSALTHLKQGAIAVSFKHGKSRVLPFRNAAHVMLVADKKALPLPPPQNAFLGKNQGTTHSKN